jgi:hypothetical protein
VTPAESWDFEARLKEIRRAPKIIADLTAQVEQLEADRNALRAVLTRVLELYDEGREPWVGEPFQWRKLLR